MAKASLEHVNITVSDPSKTADMLCRIFDWNIRWKGEAIHNGFSIHVGSDENYIAIYSGNRPTVSKEISQDMIGGLNHIAFVVEDLETVQKRVLAQGLETHSHADYEPGRRFYFNDDDGIEYEVVSYD